MPCERQTDVSLSAREYLMPTSGPSFIAFKQVRQAPQRPRVNTDTTHLDEDSFGRLL